ncbi:SPOR domain-containing protein [Dysgonomonas sp. ZJ709]|uniref:HU domain-containing protein n=1 Tax=Dysgonomonas sp. ZJ709 TaxID=2709797 RepID=UPI0013EB4F2D|nr:SPOR domain-containing protein [Dysgonomonas sp. ZJ709]
MESIIFKYINFLLPRHNCVIIPDFGGFITNIEPAKYTNNKILPPTYTISFNKELGHDDGILISHIHRNECISYNIATKKVKEEVFTIRKTLLTERIFECGKVGRLELDDYNNIIFITNPVIIHPQLWGLTHTELYPLAGIYNSEGKRKNASRLKHALGTTAAIAATVLLFIAPSTSIIDSSNTNKQEASFVQSLTKSFRSSANIQASKTESTASLVSTTNKANLEEEDIHAEKTVPSRKYHIIIGGEDNTARANSLLKKIQNSDFPHAKIIQSADRYRISAKSFDDKKTAESFLENFRKENPKYETAWLFSTRNK